MSGDPSANLATPDPAAVFAIALSVWQAIHGHASRNPAFNLSDAYHGVDEFMRVAMRIGHSFEEWACAHVVFEETNDVWPYFLEAQFGTACLSTLDAALLAEFNDGDCLRVAWQLRLPLRADGTLPVPVCVTAANPVPGAGFSAFRIQTFRAATDGDGVESFTNSDEICDDEPESPDFAIYGIDGSGLLEHIADRRTYRDALALVRRLAPGLELPDIPTVRRG